MHDALTAARALYEAGDTPGALDRIARDNPRVPPEEANQVLAATARLLVARPDGGVVLADPVLASLLRPDALG